MQITKLDSYDYMILPGVIRINVKGKNDPDLVDILSEISQSDGKIYVEGYYYSYLGNYQLIAEGNQTYMELEVTKTA